MSEMKEFMCPEKDCGSKQFVLATTRQTLVDFSQEGAIKGHPSVNYLSTSPGSIFCYKCHERISPDMTQEMLKEIV